MKELQPLLDSILEDARKEAEEIRKKGREEAEALRAKFKAEAEQLRKNILEEARRKAAEEKARRKIQAEMDAGKELLETKNQLLGEFFSALKERLAGMKDDEYRGLLRKLILRAVETGTEELFLSPADRRWLGESFLAGVNQELKNQGKKGALVYGSEVSDLSGGFLLRRGKIVHNYSLENLIAAKKDELLPEIGKRLFGS